jgi:CRP/FNR family cyclic AMP-dependent transcriptional regulator
MASIVALKKTNLFSSLSDDQLKAIAKLAGEKSFEAGQEIFKQGQKAKMLYVLLDGVVTLRIRAEEEIDLMAETLKEGGNVFGTPALMNPFIYNVTARCTKPSRILAINAAEFLKILKQDTAIGFEVMTRLAQLYFNRLNTTRAAITNLFKIFKFQTRKPLVFDTYGELK